MGGFLRQATASQARALGPYLDDTDFKTPKTALTIANTDIKLVVNGGASASKNSGGGTHRVNGVYGVTFDATDTATVGEMEVSSVVSSALPVFDSYMVVEEAVYDALFAASAPGYVANAPVSVAQWNGVNVVAPATAGYPVVLIKVGAGTGEINLSSGAVPTKGNIRKNTALAGFTFMMTDSTTHNPVTGKTVSVTRCIDGGAFGAGTLSTPAEVGVGIYSLDFAAGDLNGNTIILRATAANCDDTFVRISTSVA